jgi:PAS domain S-box-containing protein
MIALLVSAGYYLTAKIGFAFALQPGSVSTIWMPNSILLAGLLMVPRRSWWIIIVAVAPAHLASELQSGVPAAMVWSWFLSNCAQALIGAAGICFLVDDSLRFDRFRDLIVFLIFGAFLAPFLSSFLDVALVKLNGWGTNSFWDIWRVRFLSNVLATLTLVPVIVTWSRRSVRGVLDVSFMRGLEAFVMISGLVIVGQLAFSRPHLLAESTPSLLYWPLPFLLWAAVRFGPLGTGTSLLLLMFLAISGATHGQGPFVNSSSADNALSIQWFLIVISIPLMAVAAMLAERRHTEESARKNEERLAMAMHAARMGMWEWHLVEDKSSWSDETKRLFGRSIDDPNQNSAAFFDLVHPKDRLMVKEALDRAIADGSPYEAEFRMVHADGSTRWIQGKGKVLRDSSGKPVTMIGLNADITARKEAEEALRQSELRLARSEAFSLVMVTHIGLDGRLLRVPTRLCELLGYSESELLATNVKDLTHPDDFEAVWQQNQRLARGEVKSFDLQKRFIHKDGHFIWVHQNSTLVEDELGRPVHFLTYIEDITARRIAEQALLESNERNKAILRALPDLMFLQTKEGIYLDHYARDRTELLVPPESFLGKNVRDVLPPDLAEKILECFSRLDGSVEHQVLEYTIPLAGEERHFEARMVSVAGDKILSIVRDVTESRRGADALRRSEEKLLESNRQTRALAARLITAQESERRRISLLLHDDLSQNIAALGMSISRLRRKPPSKTEVMAAELDELGRQIHEITTQIRKLSHQLHPDILEHVGLVAALKSEVAEFGHNEGIRIEFQAKITSDQIPLDVSACLYRVGIEALRNISRHSGATSAVVTLIEDADSFTLEVSDSGHGFDVEKVKRGSGLGLISAEERVKLLQGSFQVNSKPECGTVLTASIPHSR